MSEALDRHHDIGSRTLGSMVAIDPESLPLGTQPDFSFSYIDIASAADGRLQLPESEIEYRNAPSRARRIIRNGDVLMSTVRPNLKAFAYCNLPSGNFIASTGFAVLRAVNGNDPRYLLYSVLSDDVTRQIESRVVGSNYPAINSAAVKRLRIPDWKPTAQRRIAEILSTLDETIERTEALIAKQGQIKAGLMHDLFTRGVTPDGRLRPTREQAPGLYKDSPLGWIPREWDTTTVRECGSVQLGRQRSPDQMSGAWTTPYLRVANVFDGFIDCSDVLEMDFTPDERRTFSLRHGDILLNEGQSLELVGRCALFDGPEGELCFQNTLVRFRPVERQSPLFYRCLFKWFFDCGFFTRIAKQTTSVAHLGADRFARMRCVSVPFPEQERIAARIGQVQCLLDEEQEQGSKLRQLKHGLMRDLLTGRVRVKGAEAGEGSA